MNQEKEFTDLLMQHQHIIYKICLMYANEKEDIGDLYQETVYKLHTFREPKQLQYMGLPDYPEYLYHGYTSEKTEGNYLST